MAHKVFICHSSKDKPVADAACAALEAHRIPCWIAPRDILAGEEYGASLIDALDECQIVLLVFSLNANNSPQVRREVERAVSKEKILVPFRIEDVLPSRAMEFALMNTHWLDALTPPLENRLNDLCDTISRLIQKHTPPAEPLWTTSTREAEAQARAAQEAHQERQRQAAERQAREHAEQKAREEAERKASEARAAWQKEADDLRRQQEARRAREADEARQRQAEERHTQEQATRRANEARAARQKEADDLQREDEATRKAQEARARVTEAESRAKAEPTSREEGNTPKKPKRPWFGIARAVELLLLLFEDE